MKCKKCKKEIPDESIYCMWCGSAQKKDKKKKMYQRPDGLFEKMIVLNGKRVPFRGKTEAEVYKKIAAYEEKQAIGRTFAEVADEWEEQHFPTLSPTTIKGYKPALIRAVDYFGDKPIKDIDARSIKVFIDAFAAKGYAQKTVLNQKLLVSLVFEYAGLSEGLNFNPTDFVKPPKGLPKKPRELPDERDIELVKQSVDLPFGLFAYFILYTGCRRGEALAIQQRDINRESKCVKIEKSIFYKTNRPEFKSPKTNAGTREVVLLDVLAEHIPTGKPDEYLFSFGGQPLTNSKFNDLWRAYAQQAGISCTPHQLRHAFATMLYEAHVDRKDAQELLGHAQISTTENIYTHISKRQKARTAEKLNDFTKNTQ